MRIIAEIGWNHMGDLSLCKRMIEDAATAGATDVKLQFWQEKKLKPGPWDDDGRRDIYKRAELNSKDLVSLIKYRIAARKGGIGRQTLQFERPQLAWSACILAGLAMVFVTGIVELALYFTIGFDPFKESKGIIEGLRSPYWLGTVLVAVVLAPLWEELSFRGFLLSALAQSRLGFVWSGLLTNIFWTGLHFHYSAAGLISVFTAGLFLTWLIWRTGSMRAAIVAHAVGNASSLAFVGFFAPA